MIHRDFSISQQMAMLYLHLCCHKDASEDESITINMHRKKGLARRIPTELEENFRFKHPTFPFCMKYSSSHLPGILAGWHRTGAGLQFFKF